MGVENHKRQAPKRIKAGVLTVSTTRNIADDKSGNWMKKALKKEGHDVAFHEVAPDDAAAVKAGLLEAIRAHGLHAVIVTGGTGLSPMDVTIEAVRPAFEKELTAFGPLFAMLSFEEIDSAAIMSRAVAGIIRQSVVFCIPGSLKACKLACKNLIFPELTHIVKHLAEKPAVPEQITEAENKQEE